MDLQIIIGPSNKPLGKQIADNLDIVPTDTEFKRFADGEAAVEIRQNVRGNDVFIIQPTAYPADNHLMELLICIDALKRASAGRITAVMPYFGYARQDSKSGPRTPITAKLVANLLATAGADRVLSMDLHARQIEGFFDICVDNLFSAPELAKDIARRFPDNNVMIVSPDVGGVIRARALAKKIDADLAIIDKRRERANESEVMNVIGIVEGRNCIIIDDIIDTAGTLINGAEALLANGANSVEAYITHGVLSDPATDRLNKTEALTGLTVTDSIVYPKSGSYGSSKVRMVSVANLFSKAIRRIHDGGSVSNLAS